jgi:hypothetical protein
MAFEWKVLIGDKMSTLSTFPVVQNARECQGLDLLLLFEKVLKVLKMLTVGPDEHLPPGLSTFHPGLTWVPSRLTARQSNYSRRGCVRFAPLEYYPQAYFRTKRGRYSGFLWFEWFSNRPLCN